MELCESYLTVMIIWYVGESIKKQPNLLLGEIDLFFSDIIAF